MSVEQEIKALRKEARQLNAKAKASVAASGKAWMEMDVEMLADFKRYTDIKMRISRLLNPVDKAGTGT